MTARFATQTLWADHLSKGSPPDGGSTIAGRPTLMTTPSRAGHLHRNTPMAITPISELARWAGVTVRALRHYESLGLLSPVRSRLRERLYPPDQCERAITIAALRRCGLALETIGGLLDERAPLEVRGEALRLELGRIEADLREQLSSVEALRREPPVLG